MATKTKAAPDWEELAIRAEDGDPEARALIRWNKARRSENPAERGKALQLLAIACNELHTQGLTGDDLPCSATLSALRYRHCERVLALSFRLTTCNVLPLPELRRCLDAAREPARQQAERERLESLDTQAPPAWWQGDAA